MLYKPPLYSKYLLSNRHLKQWKLPTGNERCISQEIFNNDSENGQLHPPPLPTPVLHIEQEMVSQWIQVLDPLYIPLPSLVVYKT